MLQDPNCNVVECGDRNCKLCTPDQQRQQGSERGFLVEQAYCVYTCESPDCSLCRVETDVLLDLFCPFNSDQDIKEMMRRITSLGKSTTAGDDSAEEEVTTFYNARQPGLASTMQRFESTTTTTVQHNNNNNNVQLMDVAKAHDSSQLIRELLTQTNPLVRHEGRYDLAPHDIDRGQNSKILDETSLMDLALELQVDKMDDLPELKGQGLIEFI